MRQVVLSCPLYNFFFFFCNVLLPNYNEYIMDYFTGEVSSIILSPSDIFRENAFRSGCRVTTLVSDPDAIQCGMQSTVLFDNEYGPQLFFLTSPETISSTVGWAEESFIVFSMGRRRELISAVDLSVANSPNLYTGVPQFELYTTLRITINPGDPQVERVPYDFLKNEHLLGNDTRMRNITLRLRTPIRTEYLLLRWLFTDVPIASLTFSEIRLCGDVQPDYVFQPIQFQTPTQEETNLLPSARDLARSFFAFVLTCTISNSGSFTWRWTKDDGPISSVRQDFRVQHFDATRSSRLVLFNPSQSDANAVYTCHVSNDRLTSINGKRQFVTFPRKLLVGRSSINLRHDTDDGPGPHTE